MKAFISLLLVCGLASVALADDLSTVDTVTGRYLSVLGKNQGETIVRDAVPPSGITGIHDIATAGGNAGYGWEMADGERMPTNACNTFAADSAVQFQGYKFKRSATITSLDWANFVYLDGGTFDATPTVEVYDRVSNTWTPVGVTWSMPYDRSFGGPPRDYAITFDAPAVNVDGVRVIGEANPDGNVPPSPHGWVATAELTVNGSVNWGVDFSNDLTELANTTPIITESQFDPINLIDNDLTTYDTTVFADSDEGDPTAIDYVGALFDEPQDNVAGLGVVFKCFGDGGVFDSFDIETYDADSDTWTIVSGLDVATYFDDKDYLTDVAPDGVEAGYLFTFDPANDVDGIRIVGDGWGTAWDGFIAATELEVFQVPEPSALALLALGFMVLRRR